MANEVDSWKKHPRYLGVTFPGVKDGDRLAEELASSPEMSSRSLSYDP